MYLFFKSAYKWTYVAQTHVVSGSTVFACLLDSRYCAFYVYFKQFQILLILLTPFFFYNFFLLSHCTARGWILQIKRNQCYHGGMETATGTHPRRKRPNAEIRKPAHSKEQVRAINVSQLETEQWIQRLRGDKEDRTKTRWEELSKAGVSRIGERMRPPPLLASHIHKPPSPSTW